MKQDNKFIKPISRRDFLKESTLITAGAFCYAYGMKPRNSYANTPGVAGNRVVWCHDENATSWDGVTGYYGDYVDQAKINAMFERCIKELTGQANAIAAWQQIIPSYSFGKKIAIKLNMNNWHKGGYNIDALPGTINGLIAGLKTIGVLESDIYLIEPSASFVTYIAAPILALYPNVQLWDSNGSHGHQVTFSYSPTASTTIHHTHPDLASNDSYLPQQIGDASYLIDMPIMKGHGVALVSLTFKNHFGSIQKGTCAKYHDYALPYRSNYSYDMNPIHDLYLNTNIRNKTVLIVGDGIFGQGAASETGVPSVWNTFDGKFPNSIFLSTDPVAIDSVMFDFLQAERNRYPQESRRYLLRAAELGLGTHEEWNNSTDKTYINIDFRKIDMNTVSRLDIDRKIKDFKNGNASELEVKKVINEYMETP